MKSETEEKPKKRVKGKKTIKYDARTGEPLSVTATLDVDSEEELPSPPGSNEQDYYDEPEGSAADVLRATYGESEIGDRIELAKYDTATSAWAELGNISLQEAQNKDAIKAIGKGDGLYKISVFTNGHLDYVRNIQIGVSREAVNPLAGMVNTAGKIDSSTGMLMFLGNMLTNQQEQNRLTLEQYKTETNYKISQQQEETKIKLAQMEREAKDREAREVREREDRKAEFELQRSREDRQQAMLIQFLKKDDVSTLMAPMFAFMTNLTSIASKMVTPKEDGILSQIGGVLKEAGPLAHELFANMKRNPAAAPGAGALPAESSYRSPEMNQGIASNAGAGNGSGSPHVAQGPPNNAQLPNLNAIKMQFESDFLPALFEKAKQAKAVDTPDGTIWEPENCAPDYFSVMFWDGFQANFPQYSREQFAQLIDSLFGGHERFLEAYPFTQQYREWFTELYSELTMTEYQSPIVMGPSKSIVTQ